MSTSKQIASMALEIDRLIRPILTLDGTIAEYAPLTLDHRRGIAYRVAHLAKDYLLLQEQNKQTEAERDVLARKLMEDNTSLEYGHEFPEDFQPRFEPETDTHATMFWIEWAEQETAKQKEGAQ